jgi:cell division protein FtsI (penicillin-binding protein 3)
VKAAEFPGLVTIKEPQRVYHYGSLAGQLLGFTDIDGKGISGVELQFDEVLHGRNGYQIMKRDGLGRRMPAVDYPYVEPVNGNSISLTIDVEYQSIAEQELRNGVEQYEAESGMVVILDPSTGEVLAMANYPPINPEQAGQAGQALAKNRVVSDMFEPGSVFKVVTASAALEHRLVSPDQKFFAENGEYRVRYARGDERTIRDIHPYGILTFKEGMQYSSNIVMAKASDKIGAEVLYLTARDFGFGTETGVDLPGEIGGELKKPGQWSGTTLNSIAYGYEVAVTPLQIACAYATIANGGMLRKPFLLRQVITAVEEEQMKGSAQDIRRVISEQTANTVRDFLVAVVEKGTGTGARVEGITVAGKTGTARKHIDGKYVPGSFTATFAGFFPADKPRAVCVVMLDTRSGFYTGGLASAPIFRNIARKVVAISDRFADHTIAEGSAGLPALPDVSNLKTESASAMLEAWGYDVEVDGSGEFVTGQSPSPGTRLSAGNTVRLRTADIQSGAGTVVIPDLRGLSIRRAMNRLRMTGLDVSISGSGLVVDQTPAPGSRAQKGARVHLRCRSWNTVAASLD